MLNKSQLESIASHLHIIAKIFESSNKSTTAVNEIVDEEQNGSKRGRKPGPVSDDIRCQHMNTKGRCKNRATKGTVCGKHITV